MASAEFFQKLGLFTVRGFLSADECRRINTAMDAGTWAEGTIGGSAEFTVNREYRRTKVMDVPDELFAEVKTRLLDLRAAIAGHYAIDLADCQVPQFLAYGPGDFYKPHRDRFQRGDGQFSTLRRVTAVIFVNEQSEAERPGTFGGGELTLYEMFDDPAGQALGLPVDPEPGLLMTFPSTQLHSVAPVRHGERRTVVSWYI
ncbi:MAG TPA: 2OG-Fe(II) oxygenase [Vicinamibacterales bacterium]|nr:2OG-Fe(II) oxygenase [Vicinamibacterales bacterium]